MIIAKKSINIITVLILISHTVFANYVESDTIINDDNKINTKKEIKGYIKHHIADSHDFSLFSYSTDNGQRKHIGFSLPVFVKTSKGIKTFMSSEFNHDDKGDVIVNKDGVSLVKIHSKIYELKEGEQKVVFDAKHYPTNAKRLIDFSITKSVLGILLVALLMFLGFNLYAKGYKKGPIPTGIGRFLEPLVLYVRDEIAKPNIGEKKYRKYMPFLLTIFFFIWMSNLLGLTPFGFNITGQITVTSCLALFTLVIYISNGTKDFWVHTLWMPGVPVLIRPLLAILELAGFFIIKPFALLVRLFANITAGHFVLMGLAALMITLRSKFGLVLSTGVSLFLTLFLSIVELLIAFIQAYIFTMLSALYIGMATEEHDYDHAEASHSN